MDKYIYMLSNKVLNGIDIKPLGNIVAGEDSRKDYLKKINESYFTTGDIESLIEKYGIVSQNETLEQIIQNYNTDNYKLK